MKKALDLSIIRRGLENGDVTAEEACDYMKQKPIQSIIENYLNLYEEDRILDDFEVQELSHIVEISYYIYTYSHEEPPISDTTYDKLFELVSKYKDEFVTLPEPVGFGEEHHAYPLLRGSLAKIHYLEQPKEKVNQSRRTLDQWIAQTENLYYQETGDRIDLKSYDVYVFPKWDGVSIIFEFDENGKIVKALTRGYTKLNTAQNVTTHFSDLERPLHGKPYGLKTEVMVKEDDLIEYNMAYGEDYKQTRSIASGIINSDERDERDKYLQVIQLRYMESGDDIEKLCPEVFDHPYIRCRLGDIDEIENFAQSHRFTEGLRCDGAVIHIIDPKLQKVLGRKNDKNNFEVAYKFTEESELSTVTDVIFQVGLFGRIAPVVKFKPVQLKGNEVSSASLGSIQRMEYLGLAEGDTVKVCYDIIPFVSVDSDCTRSGNPPILPKSKCPSCGETLTRNGAILSCENPECLCRKKGKILNYLTKMNIKGLSYAIIDKLYDFDIVTSIKDLYRLEKHRNDIVSIPGFGEKSYENWQKEINKVRDVDPSMLFGAVGIPGCSQLTFEKIFTMFRVEDIMELDNIMNTPGIFEVVPGIGEKKSPIIAQGLDQNKKLLKFLIDKVGVSEIYRNPRDAKFKVCFTKIRDEEIERAIHALGGVVVNNVTKDTDFCVVPTLGVTSRKVEAAREKEIPIIPIDDILAVIYDKFNFS